MFIKTEKEIARATVELKNIMDAISGETKNINWRFLLNQLKLHISFENSYNFLLKINHIFQLLTNCAKKNNIDICQIAGLKKIKIALLGNYTLNHITPLLKLFLIKYDIIPEIICNPYNSMTQFIFSEDSEIYQFCPEIIIIYSNIRDITKYPDIMSSKENVFLLAEETTAFYENIWRRINTKMNSFIIQNNFEIPIDKICGALEAKQLWSRSSYIRLLNAKLSETAADYKSVSINDLDYISGLAGKQDWFDEKFWYHSQHQHSIELSRYSIKYISDTIAALKGKSKKCAALDLDNTLWGGVIGDDGIDGIKIGANGEGEIFRDFQNYLKRLKNRGIILAVCSKNEEAIAKAAFTDNPDMILKLNDISCFKANWNNKAQNISEIAEELNIGLDSIVFIDDNPTERALVRSMLPEVETPEIPEDPAYYKTYIDIQNYFGSLSLSNEDFIRTDSYIQEKKRKNSFQSFTDVNEFLKSLMLEASVNKFDEHNFERIQQLINKTNQFNLTTKRYTSEQLRTVIENDDYYCYYMKLKDSYGDYGLISIIILKITGTTAYIDSWLMSCRVLNKRAEYYLFSQIMEIMIKEGIKEIKGEYFPTPKNALIKNLLPELGFTELMSTNESTQYLLCVSDYKKPDYFIKSI